MSTTSVDHWIGPDDTISVDACQSGHRTITFRESGQVLTGIIMYIDSPLLAQVADQLRRAADQLEADTQAVAS